MSSNGFEAVTGATGAAGAAMVTVGLATGGVNSAAVAGSDETISVAILVDGVVDVVGIPGTQLNQC